MSQQRPQSQAQPTLNQQQMLCTRFFRSSVHLHMALIQFQPTSSNGSRKIYRRWRRLLKALALPQEVQYRVHFLASRAYEQAEMGECHASAYDFRRATLMVRRTLLLNSKFQVQEVALPWVTSTHVPLGMTPREQLQRTAQKNE